MRAAAAVILYNAAMRWSRLLAFAPAAVTLLSPSCSRADTFGGQLHAVRAKGSLEGATLDSTGDRDQRLPSSLQHAVDAELVGADFRFDWMLKNVRLGGALMVFGVQGMRLSARLTQGGEALSIEDGFGGSVEAFAGYELLQGPVYLYADLRTSLQGFEAPVIVSSDDGNETSSDFGRATVGLGPRLGMLVPIGHSLMIDVAVYQRVVGGLERSTAFVGLGYWENDRRDAFSDWLRGSYGGEF